MMCSVEKQQKNTLDICAVFHTSIVWALFKPNVLHFVFPVRHVWQDTVRPNGPVWLLSTVGLHAEVESALSAVRQRPLRIYQWHWATTRYLLFVSFRGPLKGWFTPRWNFTHFPLTTMFMGPFLIYITVLELYRLKEFHSLPTQLRFKVATYM